MVARALALAAGIMATMAEVPANAEADRPVFVVVAGRGAVRLRLAAGATAPCDSSRNRLIFDGWVGAGTYEWATGSLLVCYQHTSGAFPEVDWSLAQVVATATRRGPAVIPISTK